MEKETLHAALRSLFSAFLVAFLCASALNAVGREAPPADIALSALPAEARQTLALIKRGGPFPYRKDGVAFGNREKHLPQREHGYYREYTVPTPGERDRGARRIVAGRGAKGDVATSGEYYYTDDHYRSFRRIRE
jgi:ribonuclease T1